MIPIVLPSAAPTPVRSPGAAVSDQAQGAENEQAMGTDFMAWLGALLTCVGKQQEPTPSPVNAMLQDPKASAAEVEPGTAEPAKSENMPEASPDIGLALSQLLAVAIAGPQPIVSSQHGTDADAVATASASAQGSPGNVPIGSPVAVAGAPVFVLESAAAGQSGAAAELAIKSAAMPTSVTAGGIQDSSESEAALPSAGPGLSVSIPAQVPPSNASAPSPAQESAVDDTAAPFGRAEGHAGGRMPRPIDSDAAVEEPGIANGSSAPNSRAAHAASVRNPHPGIHPVAQGVEVAASGRTTDIEPLPRAAASSTQNGASSGTTNGGSTQLTPAADVIRWTMRMEHGGEHGRVQAVPREEVQQVSDPETPLFAPTFTAVPPAPMVHSQVNRDGGQRQGSSHEDPPAQAPAAATRLADTVPVRDFALPRVEHDAPKDALSPAGMDRILSGARVSLSQGGMEVRLRLHPESLGEVRVQVRWEGGMLSARLQADSPAARDALQAAAPGLHTALREQGIPVEHLSISVRMDLDAHSNSQAFGFREPPQAERVASGGAESARAAPEADHTPAGRLDIRI